MLLGPIDQGSAVQGVLTIPEFIWELALAIYLIVKGFRASSPLLAAQSVSHPPHVLDELDRRAGVAQLAPQA